MVMSLPALPEQSTTEGLKQEFAFSQPCRVKRSGVVTPGALLGLEAVVILFFLHVVFPPCVSVS